MKTTCAIALSFGMALAANAAVQVVQPTSVTYTGTNPDAGIGGIINPAGLGNGAGLSASLTPGNIDTVTHQGPFDGADVAWATNDPNGGLGNDFFAGGGAQGTVSFEILLGGTFQLDTFYNWSYDFNEGLPNGNNIKTINVDYGIGDFLGGSLTDVQLSAPVNDLASTASLGGISADRLRITVTDNWFDGGTSYQGGDRVAAAEFAFTTVPEPSSTALLGLGGLALILRRRK